MIGLVLVFGLFATAVSGQGYQISQEEFDAIRKVETGGCRDPLNAEGDNGRSYGPYQIMEGYFSDAAGFNPSLLSGGKTWENTRGPGSLAYSQMVMQSYSNRYCTAARLDRNPTFGDFARIHNGGPNGYRNPNTLGYLERVESNLNRKRQSMEPYIGCADCDQAMPRIPTPCGGSGSQWIKVPLLFILVLLGVVLIQ